jgi:flagellar biosynthetic protein FliR
MIALSFLTSPEDIVFFYYVLARLTGLFVISPLFSRQVIGGGVRIFLAIFLSVMLTMVLYPDYRGQAPLYITEVFPNEKGWLFLSVNLLKEIGIGYILGFCFTLVFEAIMLAGELIDAMTGFATAASIDPMSETAQALLGPLLVVTIAMIALALDIHHSFIRVVVESFLVIPLGEYKMSPEMIPQITYGTGLIFIYALKFAVVSFIILACATIGIGFMVRIVPEYNPLLTGLPMRVLVAYYTIMLSIRHIPPVIQSAFAEAENLSRILMRFIVAS